MAFDRRKLRRVLQVQGRTTVWLADATGYRRETVSRILAGRYPMSEHFAREAARVLQLPHEFLAADQERGAA